MDLAQYGFYLGEQIVGRHPAQLLDAGLVETQAVSQFLCRRPQGRIDVAGGEPMDGKRVNQPQCHGPVGRTGEGLLDAGFEHLAAINDRPDIRHCTE